jgi:predicted  nucleic acid-binding Zn-ribbon protein
MDATLSGTTKARPQTDKKSRKRPGAWMRFLEISRDGWKRKYQDLKDSIKRLKNRVADLTKSREHWRSQAELARDQVSVLEAEIASLRVLVATSAEKKTPRTSTG